MSSKIKQFYKKNWHILFLSVVFLAYQFYISFLLWQRQGNIPPGFGDALGYIFGIQKVIKHKTLFPHIPYLSTTAHFTYLGYNLLLGSIGLIFKTTGRQVFFASFFVGKVFLLISLIFFLKQMFPNNKTLFALALLFLSFFSGNGAIHGFFWVAPSFLLLVLFFILIGLGFSKAKLNPFFLLLLSLFYVTTHPIAIYTTSIFAILTIFFWLPDKKLAKKFAVISVSLIFSTLVWQIAILHGSKSNNLWTIKNINNIFYGLTITKDRTFKPNDTPKITDDTPKITDDTPKITDDTPSIHLKFKYFDRKLEKHRQEIHQQLPSFIVSWNSFFSWFFRFPPLLILLLFGIYNGFKTKKYRPLGVFFASLAFSLASLINPYGYRSLLFLFPITIIFLSTSLIELCNILIKNKPKFKTIIIALTTLSVLIGLTGLATYGIISIKYYATIADYKVDSSQCINLIKSLDQKNTTLVFTSIESINYFLNQDLEKYNIMGINHFTNQYYHQYRRKNLVLITENYDQINPNDIDIPLSNQNNDLSRIMKTSKKLTKYDCDIFQLVHSQPTNIVP